MKFIVLMTILLVISIFIIIAVILQPGRSDGLSGSIAGGAEQLFGKKRTKGYETVLHRLTIVLSVLFVVFAVITVVTAS